MEIWVEVILDRDNQRGLKRFFKAFYGEEFDERSKFSYKEQEDGIAAISLIFDEKPPVKIMSAVAGLGKITYHKFDKDKTIRSKTSESNVRPDPKGEIFGAAENNTSNEADDSLAFSNKKDMELESTKQEKTEVAEKDSITNGKVIGEIVSLIRSSTDFYVLTEKIVSAMNMPEKLVAPFNAILNLAYDGKITWKIIFANLEKSNITFNQYLKIRLIDVVKKKTGMTFFRFLEWLVETFKTYSKAEDKKQVIEESTKTDEAVVNEKNVSCQSETIPLDLPEKTEVQEAAESIVIADLPEESSEKTYVELGVIREFIEAAQRRGEKIDFESFLTFEKNLNEIDKSLSLENRIRKALCSMKFPERLSQDEKLNWINSLVKDLSNRLNAVVMDFPAVCDGVNLETRCRLSEIISTTLKSFGIVKESVKVSMFLDMIRWIIMTEEELGAIN